LTQTYPRFEGDTSGPFIRDLAQGLASGGDEVTILTPHTAGLEAQWHDGSLTVESFRYAPEGMELVGYSRSLSSDEKVKFGAALVSPLYLQGACRALKRTADRLKPDIIHAHWAVPNGLAAGLTRLETPFGIGLHGSDVFMAEKPPIRPLVAMALNRSSFLTGCSPELVDRICDIGFEKSRSTVIPYGVDVEKFCPESDRRLVWRDRLGIPRDATVALTVGRMVTKKGFHVLLPALERVLVESPDTHVVFAGQGDRLQEFETAAAAVSDRTHFPGVILRDTLPDLYRTADLFVLPAVHDPKGNVDGLPNVILEAMATGLPIIASEISGIPLAVGHGIEGLLVPEQDQQALEEALLTLLGDSVLRQRMGRASRMKAETDLTWDSVSRRYRNSYVEALERSKH
jgi:glycosyltransferase involved in cell wall biosynthesis